MGIYDVHRASADIAENLFRDLKKNQISKIGLEEVKCAVSGFNSCLAQFDRPMTMEEKDEMINLAVRKIVMKVG